MDQDGANHHYLTDGTRAGADAALFADRRRRSPISPMRRGTPRVYLFNIDTGQQEVLGDFPGMTFAPRFSPDGNKVIMSLATDGAQRHLHHGSAHAPRGAAHRQPGDRHLALLFARRQADRLQLRSRRLAAALRDERRRQQHPAHQLRLRDVTARRCGRRAAISSPSPRSMADRFYIGVMQPDGSGERLLDQRLPGRGADLGAQRPRADVFQSVADRIRRHGGITRLYSIDLTGYNEREVITPQDASDPAWSPLEFREPMAEASIVRAVSPSVVRVRGRRGITSGASVGNAVRTSQSTQSQHLRGSTKMNFEILEPGWRPVAARGLLPGSRPKPAGTSGAGSRRAGRSQAPASSGSDKPASAEVGDRVFFDFDKCGHQAGRPAALQRQADLAEEIPECDSHHRRPLRRSRHARVQPRARRAPRQRGEAGAGRAGHRGQPHHYHQLRQGTAGGASVDNEAAWAQNRRGVTVIN